MTIPYTDLYLVFDPAVIKEPSLVALIENCDVKPFSRWPRGLKRNICVPGMPPRDVQITLYARNYFQIYIADCVVQVFHGAIPADDLAAAETRILTALVSAHPTAFRRWIKTSEGWDDDDHPICEVLEEGTSLENL